MGMTAACAEKMRAGACGDCVRIEPCRALFAQLFGRRPPEQPRRASAVERPATAGASPFLAFLGEVAKAIDSHNRPAADGPRRRSTDARRGPKDAAPEGSFRREVEQRLEPLLERGPVRIEAVARALGYSRQTLYRRLKEEGTTFAELLDGLRRRLALRYVREQGMPVKEAAYRLGFSEPAAFSRAYKRWTGSSPRRLNS